MGICSKKSSYYNLLEKSIKNEYNINTTSSFNKNYGIKKNKFIRKKKEIKFIKTNIKYYPDWKSYLLNQLESKYMTGWKALLYDSIMEENYLNQYLFQNNMFFYEYMILNAPKTIRKTIQQKFDSETVLFPLDGDELSRCSTNSRESIKSNNSNKSEIIIDNESDKSFHLNVKILNGSFASRNENDPQNENKYNSNIIKKYMEIILKELENEMHPIMQIIKKFVEFFIQEINPKISSGYDESYNYDKLKKRVIKDVQFFIEIMQVALKLFYIKSINYKFFISERDEFINLISYFLFNQKSQNEYKFYNLLYQIFQYSNEESSRKLKEKIRSFGTLVPKEAGVSAKFCLDKESEEFFEKYKKEKNDSETTSTNSKTSKITQYLRSHYILRQNQIEENIIEDIEDDSDDNEEISFTKKIFRRGSFQINKESKRKESNASSLTYDEFAKNFNSYKGDSLKLHEKITEDINFFSTEETNKGNHNVNSSLNKDIPYKNAIEYIKTIKYYKVPLEKLTVLALTSIKITESIDEYWEKEKNFFPQKFFTIDADELMSIYLYIIYNMNEPSLFTELDFVQNFTTMISKQSMVGYYYTTVNGCLNFIMNVNNKKSFVGN